MHLHIGAVPEDIAENVVMPGDPLRAKYMAEKFLTDFKRVNETRNMWGYTGYYNGKRVTIMPTGMGIMSISIYATELCRNFGCKRMVRVGTCGGYVPQLKLGDILLAQAVSTTSSTNDYDVKGHFSPIADFELLKVADKIGAASGLSYRVGNVLTSENLYIENVLEHCRQWAKYGVIGAEGEGEGLYTVAAMYGVKALMMTQVVINYYRPDEEMSAEFRERGMDDMLKYSLDVATAEIEEQNV